MPEATATALEALEIGEFVADQRTGVLSMATDGGVYAIPVPFAYATEGPAIYHRLGHDPNSQKRALVEATTPAACVLFDRTAAGWKSVVAEGHLESVSESAVDAVVVPAANGLAIPFFSVHRRPVSQPEFSILRLKIDKVSGVAAAPRSRQGD